MFPLHHISNGIDVGDIGLLVNDRDKPFTVGGGEKKGGGERERERTLS